MTDNKKDDEDNAASASASQSLRKQAEARLLSKAALSAEHIEALSAEAARQMLHELHVHQVELEMQNEELRESQLALQAARTRYFDLYDLAPVGYCTISEQGLIMQANLIAAGLLGMARRELVKKPLSQFIAKADQDLYYLHRKKLLETGEPQSCELRMVKHDGTQLWVHLAATEAQDADGAPELRAILSDVTERKRVEMALVNAETLQSAIFSSINFSIIATDQKGIIQIFNAGAEHMLGYAATGVINKITPADISDPQEVIVRAKALSAELGITIAPGFEALVFKASRGIEDSYELTYIRKDGSRFPAVMSVTALRDAQNTIIGYLLIGTDNSARMQVEAQRTLHEQLLQEANVELENAKSAADKANLAKSDFLSSMSHELRTPLSAILGFAQLMEAGSPQPTPSQKRSIGQILKAGWYLLELINEILDLALIESGKLSLSMEPMSLPNVMHECQSLIEPLAQRHGISVAFPPIDIAYFVHADRTRVKQTLVNLLSNAIKYNTVGGSVVIDCIAVTPQQVRVSVKDTGAGLPPEKLAQLFQPFNRLGQESTAEEGTGIGLVMTKRLVELMGGSIGVESTVGKGSVFWIELNLTVEPPPATTAGGAIAQTPVQTDTQLHTLLYVEDNPANLMLVEDIIERRPDIRLLSARDAIRGIEIARAALPDVVLMDINLLGISGIQALEILAADPVTAHIPVVALSANAMPRDIEKGLEAGFFRYLTKPIKVDEFMETLDVALKFAKTQLQTPVSAAKKNPS